MVPLASTTPRRSTGLSCSVHYLPQYALSSVPRRSKNQEAQQINRIQVSRLRLPSDQVEWEIQHFNSKSSLSPSRNKRSRAVGSLMAHRQTCVRFIDRLALPITSDTLISVPQSPCITKIPQPRRDRPTPRHGWKPLFSKDYSAGSCHS